MEIKGIASGRDGAFALLTENGAGRVSLVRFLEIGGHPLRGCCLSPNYFGHEIG
jgi:hypothetical protein